jgi:lactoylglutathione lyase
VGYLRTERRIQLKRFFFFFIIIIISAMNLETRAICTGQQTMLRVKDATKSVAFYEKLGFTLIDTFDFPQYNFSLYFMTTLPEGESYTLTPGTKEAHDHLWNMEGVALELTHNHGTEADNTSYHPGNGERDGFGHIAVNVDDVYATCAALEQEGVEFKKKPDEGRMKGLAFAYDPDKYWVEIVKRGENSKIPNHFNFSQTMLRIKDPAKSIAFYKAMGMKLLQERHFDDFSLYFMGSSNVPDDAVYKDLFPPVLELTHNHGTEKDNEFKHFNGNEDGRQGFGHIGFLVDDVYAACDKIREFGYGFRKEPDGGSMKGLVSCQLSLFSFISLHMSMYSSYKYYFYAYSRHLHTILMGIQSRSSKEEALNLVTNENKYVPEPIR